MLLPSFIWILIRPTIVQNILQARLAEGLVKNYILSSKSVSNMFPKYKTKPKSRNCLAHFIFETLEDNFTNNLSL